MKTRFTLLTLAGMVAAGLVSAPPLTASGQKAVPPKSASAPRTADGHVDFSGIWSPDRNFIYDLNDALDKGTTLPLQPWAEKVARERPSKDDPEAQCLPTGVPRQAPYPWRIVQTPTHAFFLFEGNIHSYRQIFLDGRKHPDDPDPTWYGHSIATWEGDTLVVDSVGFNDRFWFDFAGHPHTDKLHVVERYRLADEGRGLEVSFTVDDPGAFTMPWSASQRYQKAAQTPMEEVVCAEGEAFAPIQDPQQALFPIPRAAAFDF